MITRRLERSTAIMPISIFRSTRPLWRRYRRTINRVTSNHSTTALSNYSPYTMAHREITITVPITITTDWVITVQSIRHKVVPIMVPKAVVTITTTISATTTAHRSM